MNTGKTGVFYGYAIILYTFLLMLIMWGTLYSFGVFFKPLLTEFGWTRAMTSSAFSLNMLLYGALAIVTGRLTDRIGPRIVITVCGFLLGLGYLLTSQIGSIWQLYLFYGVIVGIGMSGSYAPLVSTVARWFTRRRGLMTGIVVAGIGIGTVIIPPLASWSIANYGWRTSYLIVGVITLVSLISIAQLLKRDPAQMNLVPYGEREMAMNGLQLEPRRYSFRQAIHTRQFWLICVIKISFGFILQTIMVHIVPHATDLGISYTSAATILAIGGGVSIAGRLVMGIVTDRIGGRAALLSCFVLISAALLWLLVSKELWMLYLFAITFGFGYGGFAPLASLIIAEHFGLSAHGTILGGTEFMFTIGSAIGPVLAGQIFDITGSYQLAFSLCVALSIIAMIFALLLRPTTDLRAERR